MEPITKREGSLRGLPLSALKEAVGRLLTVTKMAPEGHQSGGERTRTAVQTPYLAAFYMLIRPLVFVPSLPEGGRRQP